MSARVSGGTWPKRLGRFDPVSSSWKTSPPCAHGDSTLSPGTWTNTGMTCGGYVYALPTWRMPATPGTDGSQSHAPLPTPTARDWKSGASNLHGQNARPLNEVVTLLGTPLASSLASPGRLDHPKNWTRLETQVALLKTPTANLGSGEGAAQPPSKRRAGGHGPNHQDEVVFLQSKWVAEDGKDYGPAINRQERWLGREAPTPWETGPKGGVRLSSRFAEWMMGLPEGWVTDVLTSRKEQLTCIGNGVMPQQAEAAFRYLLDDWPEIPG